MPKRIGIVLFQLGGPDSLDAVRPFLYILFCDPDIIPLGPLGGVFRKPLAWYIARRRAQYVAHHYAEIGGGSPIRTLTERQARALEAALAPHIEPRIAIAMRYWHPLTDEAARLIRSAQLDALVLLPLYPQYSIATTGSSLKEWSRCYQPARPPLPLHVIEHFYNHPGYIDAVCDRIALSLTHFDRPAGVHLVFSAHGLPLSLIEQGDPYQRQVEATTRLVLERASAWGFASNPHTLCYQSKVGRQQWLEPSLTETLDRLARAGTRHILVVPIAFVTEHIETLHEINIEAREEVTHLGVEQFEMTPALGDSPRFIAVLADLVLSSLGIEAARPAPT